MVRENPWKNNKPQGKRRMITANIALKFLLKKVKFNFKNPKALQICLCKVEHKRKEKRGDFDPNRRRLFFSDYLQIYLKV